MDFPDGIWKREHLKMLLDLWEKNVPKFRTTDISDPIYEEMALELQKAGIVVCKDAVKFKVINLAKKFRMEQEKIMSNPDDLDAIWPFYWRLNKIIGAGQGNRVSVSSPSKNTDEKGPTSTAKLHVHTKCLLPTHATSLLPPMPSCSSPKEPKVDLEKELRDRLAKAHGDHMLKLQIVDEISHRLELEKIELYKQLEQSIADIQEKFELIKKNKEKRD